MYTANGGGEIDILMSLFDIKKLSCIFVPNNIKRRQYEVGKISIGKSL